MPVGDVEQPHNAQVDRVGSPHILALPEANIGDNVSLVSVPSVHHDDYHHHEHENRQSIYSLTVREMWDNRGQFLMSCMAAAVGLGNVWRFPAICAQQGGASFFIPYVIVLGVVAKPLFLLELALGQFSSKGSVRCYDLSPVFAGVGYAGAMSALLLSTFYIMIMAWAIIYTGSAFMAVCEGDLPWGNASDKFFTDLVLRDVNFDSEKSLEWRSWMPVPHLIVALLAGWVLIWSTMVRGVRASGKVAYVTALAPYSLLLILVSVGLCLDGAWVGVVFFFVPDWERLFDHRTWYEAVGQCFFSLGIGFGGLVSFSSYNPFHHDIFSDVMVIGIVDFLTSLMAGLSLMTILGFRATQTYNRMNSTEIEHLVKGCDFRGGKIDERSIKLCQLKQIVKDGGTGLVFIQLPAAMYEISETWGKELGGFLALIFFVMLIVLAIGAATGLVGTTVTIVSDRRPDWNIGHIVTGVCAVSFFIGTIYTCKLGQAWIDVIDNHGVTAVVYLLGCLEAFAVVYVYGIRNFCEDLEFMMEGKKVPWYFELTWSLLPLVMIIVYLQWLFTFEPKPHWTPIIRIFAWLLTFSCLLIIPGVGVHKMLKFKKKPWRELRPKDILELWRKASQPARRWGPKDVVTRVAWKYFKKTRERSPTLWERFWYFITRRKPGLAAVQPAINIVSHSHVSPRPAASSTMILAPSGSFGRLVQSEETHRPKENLLSPPSA